MMAALINSIVNMGNLLQQKYHVIIIGAGPAGLMAAITAASNGHSVLVLEKNKQAGRKLLMSGNGRCNLTNGEPDQHRFLSSFGKNGKFLYSAWQNFNNLQTISFFNDLGLQTTVESDGRIFPAAGNSKTVLNLLLNCLQNYGGQISYQTEVKKILFNNGRITKVITNQGEVKGEKWIVATGGLSYPLTGSTGDGWSWAKEAGHQITIARPVLVPLKAQEKWIKKVEGISLSGVKIKLKEKNINSSEMIGDLIFTRQGISGPSVLNFSRFLKDLLPGKVILTLDFLPKKKKDDLDQLLRQEIEGHGRKELLSVIAGYAPRRLARHLIESLAINPGMRAGYITRKQRGELVKALKQTELTVVGTGGFKQAMVTAGGIRLAEINQSAMRSKLINNLYFAGEVLDLDGPTGGYNLQVCWTTGYVAGLLL